MSSICIPVPKRKISKIPSVWKQFRYSPVLFIARKAFALSHYQTSQQAALSHSHGRHTVAPHIASSEPPPTARIVCISDSHNAQDRIPALPPGDILIHAGDLTHWGTEREIHEALRWLNAAPHPHKVFIAGNHDSALAIPERRESILAAYPDLIYLEDSSTTVTVYGRKLTLFGSPRTPRRGSGVFMYPHGEAMWEIPPETDILITHGPPKFHLDVGGYGCDQLLQSLWKIRPRLHVFGHIHGGRGVGHLDWSQDQEAYEAVCAKEAGMKAALQVVLATLSRKMRKRWLREARASSGTILVNASWWGQPEDGSAEGAVVVDIPLPSKEVKPSPEPPQEHPSFDANQSSPVPSVGTLALDPTPVPLSESLTIKPKPLILASTLTNTPKSLPLAEAVADCVEQSATAPGHPVDVS
ncbi:hypothetical protein BN946_scf184844.g27 [Trametes cinnabarina]|uniref:Calcineurin-like phosphoesterase domain-containing protein n=1 Tax=Pycnoporus cinnabarinus TaxID=5643 RepID=A0A060SF31_PYCCI|nr:hypothetical protein BN946_scf184844.g27 [Trametes cinnabarina]